jgi:hypothetical protein
MRRIMVVGLLALVSTIFIMPGVTLPKTILEAQQVADQIFWLLATAVPGFLVNFTVPLQPLGVPPLDAISTLPGPPAAPVVLIC